MLIAVLLVRLLRYINKINSTEIKMRKKPPPKDETDSDSSVEELESEGSGIEPDEVNEPPNKIDQPVEDDDEIEQEGSEINDDDDEDEESSLLPRKLKDD